MFSSQFQSSSKGHHQPISESQIHSFKESVRGALVERLHARTVGELSVFGHLKPVKDDATKLMITDTNGRKIAVASCSSPMSPDMMARALENARAAKKMLGDVAGRPILNSLCDGKVDKLTYFAVPYCAPLSRKRLLWIVQRFFIRGPLFRWLVQVAELTAAKATDDEVERNFRIPLTHLANMDGISQRVRDGASSALERISSKAWIPHHTLMHGDLWRGNILIAPADIPEFEGLLWQDRFVIIDWPGCMIKGYAMCDLIRLAESLRLADNKLHANIRAHCRILNCEMADARNHLLAGMAYMGMNLEHFPLARFAALADSSLAIVDGVSG